MENNSKPGTSKKQATQQCFHDSYFNLWEHFLKCNEMFPRKSCWTSNAKMVALFQRPSEVAAADTETARQLLLYEERLEDMRQELVRQDQEHQQATELLRQGHMQQMERQKENQDQLLAELESLKVQLAEVIQNSASELIWVNKGTSLGRFISIYAFISE